MTAESHARAKALFLQARQLDAAGRKALLDEACADDEVLREEVESLLAHDLPGTILAPPERAWRPALGSPTATPLLSASPLRRLLRQRRTLLAGGAAMAVVLSVGLWTLDKVSATLHVDLSDSLSTILGADIEALDQWASREQELVQGWAGQPDLRRAVATLRGVAAADASDPAAALLASPAQADLRALLGPVLKARGFRAFGVVERTGLLLASSKPRVPQEVVGTHLSPAVVELTARIFDGETLLQMPYLLGAISRIHTEVSSDRVLSVYTPVRDDTGAVQAALVFLMEPDDDFTRILSIARMGESGDTYAFNAEGLLLSHSRFESELVEPYGLKADQGDAMLNIHLVDPGGNLLEGYRPKEPLARLPLAPRVVAAAAGQDGVDTAGYRDIRGVMVVGAWRWLPRYGIGVATEVERAEAYRAIGYVRTAFGALLVVLLLTLVTLLGTALAMGSLRARMQQLGQYTLVRPLGEGGMGVVYEAHHALLRRPVALKLIRADRVSADTLARFEREVQLTSALSHVNTIQVYDFGRTDEGVFYYVMEYLSGESLGALIARDGAQPAARVVHILRQALGSLAEAHAAGLVHRDIKPGNIMLCTLGGVPDTVKVLDFGLVKQVDVSWNDDATLPGQVLGTPAFIAPEALQNPLTVDARADLYSLGAVAYELLTGEQVFPGASGPVLLSRVLTELPQRPSAVASRPIPGGLDELIQALLAKDPYARPQSALDVLARLDAMHDVEPWVVTPLAPA